MSPIFLWFLVITIVFILFVVIGKFVNAKVHYIVTFVILIISFFMISVLNNVSLSNYMSNPVNIFVLLALISAAGIKSFYKSEKLKKNGYILNIILLIVILITAGLFYFRF